MGGQIASFYFGFVDVAKDIRRYMHGNFLSVYTALYSAFIHTMYYREEAIV